MSVLQQQKIAALETQVSKLIQSNNSLRGELKKRPSLSTLHTSGARFHFSKGKVHVTTATPEESPFPFTEYGKTVTLSPNAVEDEQLENHQRKHAELMISAEKYFSLSILLSGIAISIILVIARHFV
jgi:hypothetical protein